MTADYSPVSEPEDIARVFVEAWNRRDPDRLAELFDEDAEFVNVVGIWWHDREAIRKAHAYGLTTIFQNSTLRLRETRVKYLSDSIAVVHARMFLSGQTPISESTEPGVRRNIFSFIVHKAAHDWSCAAAHNTDIVPGAETNVITPDGRSKAVDYRK